jgi:hypothetical protein
VRNYSSLNAEVIRALRNNQYKKDVELTTKCEENKALRLQNLALLQPDQFALLMQGLDKTQAEQKKLVKQLKRSYDPNVSGSERDVRARLCKQLEIVSERQEELHGQLFGGMSTELSAPASISGPADDA